MKISVQIISLLTILVSAFISIQAGAQSAAQGQGRLFVPVADEIIGETEVRTVRINFGLLRSARLQLDLGDGLTVDGVRDRDLAMGPGRRAWVGHVNGASGDRIIFGQSGDALAGIINTGDRKFELFYIGRGLHGIREIGRSAPFPEAPPIAIGPGAGGEEDTGGSGEAGEPAAADAGDTVIGVLVGYTVASRNRWGGTNGIQARIVTAVAETNDSYSNSNVPITLQLAHMMEVIGAETGNSSTDLGRIRSTSDGYWDEIHGARTTYGGDVVVLIEEMAGVCGRGYVMLSLSDSFKSSAFSVVESGCAAGYYSFGHEIGHNLGSMHDPANSGYEGVYPFSFGYQDPAAVFRTVMAYNCPGGCTRVQHFSNPNVTYAATGLVTGVTGLSDNAQSLTLVAPTAANWYSATPLVAPLAPDTLSATATSQSTIRLEWIDNSDNEDQFRIERSLDGVNFTEIATTNANIEIYDDSGLAAATNYYYQVSAYNGAGTSGPSNVASAETQAPAMFVDQYAQSEQPVHGGVSGSYSATQSADGSLQRISESHSGGKPSNRYTWLEHRWTFSVAAGNAISVHLTGATSANSGEVMQFAYSTDNANWTDLVALQDTSDASVVVLLPSSLNGTVYLRIADLHRVPGVQTGHWVEIDQLMIRSENGSVSGTPRRDRATWQRPIRLPTRLISPGSTMRTTKPATNSSAAKTASISPLSR